MEDFLGRGHYRRGNEGARGSGMGKGWGLKVVYLFLDAVYLALRQGTKKKERILCAYGILENGKKVLLHLALGGRESYDI